ncbi:MAG TPA: ABC transporter permease [Kofleriaceae bacterium]
MSDVRDTLVIARRELAERVQSKWFVAITLLGPIGMVALVIIPSLLIGNPAGTRIEIIDQTCPAEGRCPALHDRKGALATPLSEALALAQWKPVIIAADTPEQVEMDRIRDKQINGFVTIPEDALGAGVIVYRGDNGSSPVVRETLRLLASQLVQAERGRRAQISPDKLASIIQPVAVESRQTNGKNEAASGQASFFLGYALAYILFLVITIYAVAVMRSVVQEKTSRVMELMVATVKPRSLMAGKILGVGGAGLIQVAIWLTIGALTLAYREQILGLFGASGGGSGLPSLSAGEVVVALLYFVLGYFFYASIYAAVGAMVSSEQDTQQVQLPVTLLLVVGIVSVTAVSGDPRGFTAAVMTTVPFWSPLLMPMRILLGGASAGEVALSLVVLAVATVLVASAAARIYRVGVLMYGKRPSPRELLRWLRY